MTGGPASGEADRAPTRVPLFPLALVLFPGTQLPLHIFEPRYRAMLADARAADGRFGIVLRTGEDERAIPPGHVGCYAIVREVVPVGDGRSNILVDAGERFTFEQLVDAGTPYHVAEVRPYSDQPVRDLVALADAARRVRAAFARVTRAARTLADEPFDADPTNPDAGILDVAMPVGAMLGDVLGMTTGAPPLPADDTQVAFAAAAAVELELSTRQRVLASSDAVERTMFVARLLERALPGVESRADLHRRARSNGHGSHDPPESHV